MEIVNKADYWMTILADPTKQGKIKTADNEFNKRANALFSVLENTLIASTRPNLAERWEQDLAITPFPAATLAERKNAILTMLSDGLHSSLNILRRCFEEIVGANGYQMSYDPSAKNIELKINDADWHESKAKNLCNRLMPGTSINIKPLYNRQYVQPVMASCTTWRNEPSFGMRVWAVTRMHNVDIIYDDDNEFNSIWNPRLRYPYWPFSREPMPAWGGSEPFFYLYARQHNNEQPIKICMEFDRPLIIKSIRFRQMMEGNGWVDIAIIRNGVTVATYRVPNFDNRTEARQTEHIIEVPVEAQAPSTFYEFMATASQYGWSSGIITLNNDVYIDAVY